MQFRKTGVAPLGAAVIVVAIIAGCFGEDARADPPTFASKPASLVVQASRASGIAVSFALPPATDDAGSPAVTCDWQPGDLFPPGVTVVTCTAEDQQTGETSTVSFKVRVLAPPQEQAASGNTKALLYYTKTQTSYGLPEFKNIRLLILRAGTVSYEGGVPRYPHNNFSVWPAGFSAHNSMKFRDLNGDGEPELLLDLYWGGAHCCYWTDIYRYHPTSATYTSAPHFWGDLFYRVRDLDHDPHTLEFVSGDDRFAYAFTSFADSSFPIALWRYADGSLVDITRRFPALIAQDAARQWRGYVSYLHSRGVRGMLGAWAADECLLNRCAAGLARLQSLGARGLTGPYDSGAADRFLTDLRAFLHKQGYWR